MNAIDNFITSHPYIALASWTLFQWVFSAYASSLRAPTVQSSQAYLSWFAIINTVAGNLKRISPPIVENSPNFQAAVTKLKNGGSDDPKNSSSSNSSPSGTSSMGPK